MAIQAQEALRQTAVDGVRTSPAPAVDAELPEIGTVWVCPLIKTLCTTIAEAPGPEACGECRIHKTWHLADNVDQRFWY